MYAGDNKTALYSQQLLADAMLTLLREKSYSEISVSDLCKAAGVSRQTFYSLFGSKDNVILFTLQNNCRYEPEPEEKACRSACFRDFCVGYSRYIVEKREILELLVKNDIMRCLYDVQYDSLMQCEHFVGGIEGEDRLYLVDFIAGGMNSIAKNYVLTGCTADSAFLERLMYKLFGGGFFSERKHSGT
ncbi:MAG: TetR/AcrR family transcriptional regulator [Clostridia bacterium]|nr:TetR/AcrR family transcriptional regulator [Clostridia bacterium]